MCSVEHVSFLGLCGLCQEQHNGILILKTTCVSHVAAMFWIFNGSFPELGCSKHFARGPCLVSLSFVAVLLSSVYETFFSCAVFICREERGENPQWGEEKQLEGQYSWRPKACLNLSLIFFFKQECLLALKNVNYSVTLKKKGWTFDANSHPYLR